MAETITLWEAAMRLIEGQPRGNWAELGNALSDYPPDTADKLAWLATDARSTNLLCDLLIAVRAGAIEATPSLAEIGALDPFKMRIGHGDALTVRASGKVRTKAEANRLLASLIGERGAYHFYERDRAPIADACATGVEQSIYAVAMRRAGRDPNHELFSATATQYPLSRDDLERWMRSWPRRQCQADDVPSAWDYCRELTLAVEQGRVNHRRIDDPDGRLNPFATKIRLDQANVFLDLRFGPISPALVVPIVTLNVAQCDVSLAPTQQSGDAEFGARQREASSLGGRNTRKRSDDDRCRDVQLMKANKPSLSWRAIFRHVAKASGDSPSIIKTVWYHSPAWLAKKAV